MSPILICAGPKTRHVRWGQGPRWAAPCAGPFLRTSALSAQVISMAGVKRNCGGTWSLYRASSGVLKGTMRPSVVRARPYSKQAPGGSGHAST